MTCAIRVAAMTADHAPAGEGKGHDEVDAAMEKKYGKGSEVGQKCQKTAGSAGGFDGLSGGIEKEKYEHRAHGSA